MQGTRRPTDNRVSISSLCLDTLVHIQEVPSNNIGPETSCYPFTRLFSKYLFSGPRKCFKHVTIGFFFGYETIGTAATPVLLCQPRVIMKMIVESMMECRLAGETEVLGENLPQRHFCPSQNPTCPPGFEPGPARMCATIVS
jgi:hypothetical protein